MHSDVGITEEDVPDADATVPANDANVEDPVNYE